MPFVEFPHTPVRSLPPKPIGEITVSAMQHHDEGTSHVNDHPLDGVQEDPLRGDVDHFVHPDETRTDEQAAFDRQYAIKPYGHDAAEDYWQEYDEYHGTVNGGEEPEPALKIEPHKGYPDGRQVYVTTSKRQYQEHPDNIQKMRDAGMSDEQIAERLDRKHDEIQQRTRAERSKLLAQTEEDDYDGEDPLAGDVDR